MFTRPSRVANRSRNRKADQLKDKLKNRPPRQRPGLMRIGSMLSMAVLGGGLVVAAVTGYGMWRTGEQFMDGVKLMFTPKPPGCEHPPYPPAVWA